MSKKVAVVTGANRGIGLGIVRTLCSQFDGDVFLTARDEVKGRAAVEELEREGLKPKFHPLDISDHSSIKQLRDFLLKNYGGLDVLVNNAGIALKDTSLSFAERVEKTVQVNYFDNLACSNILMPILRSNARVCNISSMASSMAVQQCSPEIVARLTKPDLEIEELSAIMNQFIQAAKDDTFLQQGFPQDSYGFPKIGLTVMTAIHQWELDKQGREDILVNACTPGYVSTDMTKHRGGLSVAEGVVTPMYCITLPAGTTSPRGQMLRDKVPVDWVNFKIEMPSWYKEEK
ncbi:carbonyl reductase [NADPH] 3-like isoform X2 [Physella acuta]|uniref:carbonyl reductase [NADPH] 3-like isoform X2 n=1 Tax=Physella acuta TaxID=109671 RepID=UPI0027DD0DB6|nr:carbonyl reductase [NADPH] 3-like isoform X2 [Physella acuta]